jgi:chromate reductase, NAD(P)H dehydrogenase (quinone)
VAAHRNLPQDCRRFKPGLIDGDGQVSDETTTEFLHNYMTEFNAIILRVTKVLPKHR